MQAYNHSKKLCGDKDYYKLAKTLSALSVYKSNIAGLMLKTTDHKDAGCTF